MAMAATKNDEIKTLTTHYIDGAFVESRGREVVDTVKPTNGKVIVRVTLADEEDTRRAIDAAKRAIVNACAPSLSATRPIPKSLSDRWCRRSSTSVCSPIRKGIEEGAEVLVGGEGYPQGLEAGYFVKPTVFVNVKNDMTIAGEEIFGPVLGVIAYDTEDDAVAPNDSRYGLHAAVLGADLARARRVASRLRTGRVVINGMTDDPQAPWGGFKYSGVEAFLETRAILEA
jgi:aldehyde dehydrogenase (NAD+)